MAAHAKRLRKDHDARLELRQMEKQFNQLQGFPRPAATPRVGAGVGISWRTAFGLINVDLAPFVYKQPGDQTQIFRFGFGTRF